MNPSNADNMYSVLGCSEDSTPQDIKKRYHEIAREVHPDKQGTDNSSTSNGQEGQQGCHDTFAKVSVAYSTLIDSEARAKHDASLIRQRLEEPIVDDVPFDEFEFNDDEAVYQRPCRCGSFFSFCQEDLEEVEINLEGKSTSVTPPEENEKKSKSFLCPCDSCSLHVRVIVNR